MRISDWSSDVCSSDLLLQGTKEGLREFARAYRTGEASDFVSKIENQGQKAISGKKGEILRIPTRLLTAEDELFKAMARRMDLTGMAAVEARMEGLTGQGDRGLGRALGREREREYG